MKTKNKKDVPSAEIEQLSDSECTWPDCGEQQDLFVTLPVMEQSKKGGEVRTEINMTVPFCRHHGALATQGLTYVLKQGESQFLQAPFTMIDIAERVFFALKSEEKDVGR